MDLESAIRREVSQQEKNNYHILTHICIHGIWKNCINEPICKAERDTHVENECMDTKGEGDWVDMLTSTEYPGDLNG